MGRLMRIVLPILTLLFAVSAQAEEKQKPKQKPAAVSKVRKPKAQKKEAKERTKKQLQAIKKIGEQVRALRATAATFQARQRFRNLNVSKDVDRKDAAYRALVLTPVGPLVVELVVSVDGKPFRELQESLVDDMLKEADTNKDGKRSWDEALKNPRFAFGRLRTVIRNKTQLSRTRRSFDSNGNGVVDRYEARALLAQYFGLNNIFMTYVPTTQANGQASSARAIIDQDNNTEISKDEWLAATDRLKSRDADDNDVLEQAEVNGTAAGQYAYPVQVLSRRGGYPGANQNRVVLLNAPKEQHVSIYRALFKRYKMQDEKSRKLPLVDAFIKVMDADKSGDFNLDDMQRLAELEPQLSIEVNLGNTGGKRGAIVRKVDSNLKMAQKVGHSGATGLALDFSGMKLKVQGVYSNVSGRYANTGKVIVQRVDKNNNGYIEKKEADANRQYSRLFESFDLDGDGKAYPKEIAEYYDRSQRPTYERVGVTMREENNAVFSLLDANNDGRLGLREIRMASKRLQGLDKNKDGKVSAQELPQTVSCTVARGPAYGGYYQPGLAVRSFSGRPRRARTQRGPAWFVRMDRNSDGDVSRREFPGEQSQFTKLDTDKDGFIDRKEAEAFKATDGD